MAVEPVGDGGQSYVTIQLDLQGYGIGKILVPVVVRQARQEAPQSCQKLKKRLEGGR